MICQGWINTSEEWDASITYGESYSLIWEDFYCILSILHWCRLCDVFNHVHSVYQVQVQVHLFSTYKNNQNIHKQCKQFIHIIILVEGNSNRPLTFRGWTLFISIDYSDLCQIGLWFQSIVISWGWICTIVDWNALI